MKNVFSLSQRTRTGLGLGVRAKHTGGKKGILEPRWFAGLPPDSNHLDVVDDAVVHCFPFLVSA